MNRRRGAGKFTGSRTMTRLVFVARPGWRGAHFQQATGKSSYPLALILTLESNSNARKKAPKNLQIHDDFARSSKVDLEATTVRKNGFTKPFFSGSSKSQKNTKHHFSGDLSVCIFSLSTPGVFASAHWFPWGAAPVMNWPFERSVL